MSLPVVGQIIEATPAHPYLCVRIDLDPALVNELLVQLSAAAPVRTHDGRALFLARTSAALLDAVQQGARHLDRSVQMLVQLQQGPDHPVHPAIPETDYLKGFICRVLPA